MKPVTLPDSIKTEWRENFRLRMGCWCIFCIAFYLGYQSLADITLDVKNRCLKKNEQILRLQQVAGETIWPKRLADLTSVRLQFEQRLLSADSRGLAKASTQTWLATILQQHDVKHRRVKVNPPVPLVKLPGVWQVSATLEGDFIRQSIFQVLLALESSDHFVAVDRLEIRGNKKQRFVMDVTVFCAIAEK